MKIKQKEFSQRNGLHSLDTIIAVKSLKRWFKLQIREFHISKQKIVIHIKQLSPILKINIVLGEKWLLSVFADYERLRVLRHHVKYSGQFLDTAATKM